MDGAVLGYDLNIKYGAIWAAGMLGGQPGRLEVHDYNQTVVFMGLDTYDLGYLGAEIEWPMGEEKETYMITTATAVAIPKGLAHGPAHILRMDDRFIYMIISGSPNLTGKIIEGSDKKIEKKASFCVPIT